MAGKGKGKAPGRMFGPVGGLGKKYAIINGNKFYTVENLFQGIRERAGDITEENMRIGQVAYEEAVERGKEMMNDPETVIATARATQVGSKVVTDESIEEIVRDMQTGAIVEEVEYDNIETNITEDGVEDVIYVGGKTRSIYTPKKDKERAWRVFWDRVKSIDEEEEVGVDPTKGTMDQEDIIFGAEMEEDHAAGGKDWHADQPEEETDQGWGGNSVGDPG